jgi:flagellar assembly factor FliW
MVMTRIDEPVIDAAIPELRFPAGLPGFPGERRFGLVRWGGDDSPFSLLQSIEEDGLQFLVVPPDVFFPDYAPEVGDDVVSSLGLQAPEDAILLVIVTVGDAPQDATANLLGPVVVNRHTLVGAQAVLTTGDHDPRRRLVSE